MESSNIRQARERLNKSKTVNAILQSILSQKDLTLDELYEKIAYPLAREHGHAYDAFKKALPFALSFFFCLFHLLHLF